MRASPNIAKQPDARPPLPRGESVSPSCTKKPALPVPWQQRKCLQCQGLPNHWIPARTQPQDPICFFFFRASASFFCSTRQVLQCGLVASKPASNKSRSAGGLWTRLATHCIFLTYFILPNPNPNPKQTPHSSEDHLHHVRAARCPVLRQKAVGPRPLGRRHQHRLCANPPPLR